MAILKISKKNIKFLKNPLLLLIILLLIIIVILIISNSVANSNRKNIIERFEEATNKNTTVDNDLIPVIEDSPFNCPSAYSTVIKDNKIADNAFSNCKSLPDENIPSSVTSIGKNAFYGSDLVSIEIPNSVTSIGNAAFFKCLKLTSVKLPSSLEIINQDTFYSCPKLSKIIIPKSIITIDQAAFQGYIECTGKHWSSCSPSSPLQGLSEIVFEDNSSLKTIELGAFGFTPLKEIIIPDSVTKIGANAFQKCSNLSRVKLPSNLEKIENKTFILCNKLTKIKIPSSVKSIGDFAFQACFKEDNEGNNIACYPPAGLQSIIFDENSVLETIGAATFGFSALKSINIPLNIETIGKFAFEHCYNLVSITIPKNTKIIEEGAFTCCKSLKTIIFENETPFLKTIGDFTFSETVINIIKIPPSVISIGNSAFYQCKKLKSIDIPVSVTSIGETAFGECYNLKSINISKKIQTIGPGAFYKCKKLKSIYIPVSLTSIKESAFEKCTELESIKFNTNSKLTTNNFEKDVFKDCKKIKRVYNLPSNIDKNKLFGENLENITFESSK